MEAVRRSGYTPNSVARNLRTRRTMTALVVVPNLANPVFAQILRGVDDELTQSGYGLIIGNLDNCPEREPRYVDLALSRQADGVLLMNGRIPGDGKRHMGEAGLPMVALCAAISDERIPNVVVQDREASRAAVRHLLRLGHRRLGYVGGLPGNIIETERYAGFREGMAEVGLGERDIVRWEGRFVFWT
jgi:LacI family repressor for deo operon, udp, cdd, tsx, nupC, and nupG